MLLKLKHEEKVKRADYEAMTETIIPQNRTGPSARKLVIWLDRQKPIITNVSVTVGNVKYYSFCPLSLMHVLLIYKTIP